MSSTPYGRVLANPRVRLLLALGFALRVPMFGVSVVLTLHVVDSLHRTWVEAGLVAAVATLSIAASGPWRGRLLDRIGLRRVVLPSVVVTAACWCVAPFVGYLPLLALSALAGLFAVPTFTVIRQGLIAATTEDDRRTTLALDGIFVEFGFMVGPIVGIALAGVLPTAWVILGLEMASAVMALVLWLVDPPIRTPAADQQSPVAVPRDEWLTARFLAVCMVGFAGVFVLAGSDVSFVAAAKAFEAPERLGLVLTVWGLGSVIGGLTYGALPKAPPPFALLALLAATTAPLALSTGMLSLTVWGFVAGLLCAPTMASSIDALTRVVPPAVRGEAMGWHGSALTLGGALGGPLAGWFIDGHGFRGGFASVAAVGGLLAVAGVAAMAGRRRRAASA